MRDDLPRPEKVTGETNIVEVREPTVRRLGLGRGVEKLRDGGVGGRGPLFLVAFGDGFGGDAVGNEAPAEGGGVFCNYYLYMRVSCRFLVFGFSSGSFLRQRK